MNRQDRGCVIGGLFFLAMLAVTVLLLHLATVARVLRDGAAGGGQAPFASMVAIFRPGLRLHGNGKQQLLFPFLAKRP